MTPSRHDRGRRPWAASVAVAAVGVLVTGLLGLLLAQSAHAPGWFAHSLAPLAALGWFVARSALTHVVALVAVGLATVLALVADDLGRRIGVGSDVVDIRHAAAWSWVGYGFVAACLAAGWSLWRSRAPTVATACASGVVATLLALLAAACATQDGDPATAAIAAAAAALVLAVDRNSLKSRPLVAGGAALVVASVALAVYGIPERWDADPRSPIGRLAVRGQ